MAGMNERIILLHIQRDTDSPFQNTTVEKRTEIWAEHKPLYSGEFHKAKANGIELQHIMLTRSVDYEGQTLAEYAGKTYSIYRTYLKNEDWIELYLSDMEHTP